ncbi:MAG: patatin-like phospholipase family protein [Burkholderiaceae bacterium]|nr:patatin-like phospholipase family protein [Burkholderiaceae bacterium]
MNIRPIIATIAAILLFGGCAAPRPAAGPDNPSCDLERFVRQDVYSEAGIYRITMKAAGASLPMSVNLLALSAGGEFGAYGAGVLIGWSSAGTRAQPSARQDVQIVTGVSTGTILATHAFLGKDEEIEQAYLSSSGKTIYKARPRIALLWSNSLLDASGKRALIESYLTTELIDEVAKAPDGKGLYIGVVDADSGEFQRINMIALANGLTPTQRRDDCYRAVVNASSAIPIAFQPQFIDGRMFIDGGARRHLFLTELPAALQEPGVTRRMFAFVHGDLSIEPSEVDNHVLDLAGRLSELVTEQGMRDSIQIADFLAHEPVRPMEPSSKPEPMFLTYYAAAAAAAASCAPKKLQCKADSGLLSEDMFCQPFMACLAQEGRRDGAAYARGEVAWPQWSELRRPTVMIKSIGTPVRRSPSQ